MDDVVQTKVWNLDILEAILTNKLPVFSSFCKTVINIAL